MIDKVDKGEVGITSFLFEDDKFIYLYFNMDDLRVESDKLVEAINHTIKVTEENMRWQDGARVEGLLSTLSELARAQIIVREKMNIHVRNNLALNDIL